jgi:aryl-alcohol dehydrogenase-like predicted oxidoreductase
MIDTSPAYHRAEEMIGWCGKGHQVITKLAKDRPRGDTEKMFEVSLKKMGRDSVYALLAHDVKDLFQDLGKLILLKKIKEDGRAQKIGVSVYEPRELEKICELFTPDIVQVPLSAFDQRFKDHLITQTLAKSGTEFHARSIFLQGSAFMKEKPEHLKSLNPEVTPMRCVQFIKEQSWVNGAVVGFDSVSQLQSYYELSRLEPQPFDFETARCDDLAVIDPRRWK